MMNGKRFRPSPRSFVIIPTVPEGSNRAWCGMSQSEAGRHQPSLSADGRLRQNSQEASLSGTSGSWQERSTTADKKKITSDHCEPPESLQEEKYIKRGKLFIVLVYLLMLALTCCYYSL